MSTFRLTLPLVGGRDTKIEVDGKPVSDACSIAVKSEVGGATKVYIELVAGGTLEGEGIVHVVKDGTTAVADWLAMIDPDELEQAALAGMGALSGLSTGAAMLEVLRGWAGGGA